MTKTDAIRHFGSKSRLAKLLGVTPGAVSLWPERLPGLRQYQLAAASSGKLKVDDEFRVSPSPREAA